MDSFLFFLCILVLSLFLVWMAIELVSVAVEHLCKKVEGGESQSYERYKPLVTSQPQEREESDDSWSTPQPHSPR